MLSSFSWAVEFFVDGFDGASGPSQRATKTPALQGFADRGFVRRNSEDDESLQNERHAVKHNYEQIT
jgi:hypothetical protein